MEGRATASPTVRLALVDDHELVVDAIVAWLATNAPDITISYAGSDAAAALAIAHDLDVVVLDLDLGAGSAEPPALVREFEQCGAHVLIVSAAGNPPVVRATVLAGALGYVSKSAPSATLLDALRTVATGRSYVSPDLAGILLEGDGVMPRPDLSPQESVALQLYASGLKMDSVARRMNVSPHTAKEYIDRVRAKYGAVGRSARTKTELYMRANEDGLLDGDSSTSFT